MQDVLVNKRVAKHTTRHRVLCCQTPKDDCQDCASIAFPHDSIDLARRNNDRQCR
jgi:hypothetical protein